MKSSLRFFAVFLLPLFLLCAFSACGKSAVKPGFPPVFPDGTEVVLTVDGHSERCRVGFSGGVLTLTSAEGYLFVSSADGCFLTVGDLRLPLPCDNTPDRGLLFEALSLSPDEPLIERTEKDENGKETTVWTFVGETENYLFQTDETGAVTSVRGEGRLTFSAVFTFPKERAHISGALTKP